MDFSSFIRRGIWTVVLVLLIASPLAAQIEDHITAYTGKNAEGYLDPLVDAMGNSLGGGLYRSGHIPKMMLNIAIEFPIMGLYFSDDDETFMGMTEAGFTPEQTVAVPTVVGPTDAVIVDGSGGTSFAFPGGFDVGSFIMTVPQIRVGSFYGTEAMARFIAFRIGDSELGDVMLAGFGVRHSLSQYMGPVPPVDLSASFFYQKFKLGENQNGDDLSNMSSYSLGLQVSKTFPPVLTPYAGLYYNSYKADVVYVSEATGVDEEVSISFDKGYAQLNLGLELNLWVFNLFGEYHLASRSSFAFGLGLAL
jgi:hypothetical protein